MDYPDILQQLSPTTLCEDAPETLPLPSEIELQSLWFNGQFGRTFTTTDGQSVNIIQLGDWNRGQGPDFLRAVVDINGQRHHGPLEIDTRPSDWVQHQHSTNPAFDSTILHVVFQSETTQTFTRTSNHRCVPRVILSEAQVQTALQRSLYATHTTHLGRCSTPLRHLSVPQIEQFMHQAVTHRLQLKYAIFQRTADIHGEEQALWLSIAQTLGYRPNKLNMTVLAQRLPIRALSQQGENIVPFMFGTAGYLHPDIHEEAQHDAKQWLRNLWDSWWQIRQHFELTPARSIPWSRKAIRPVNHPQRRLAALACIVQNWAEFRRLTEHPEQCLEFLTNLKESFWNHHYTLTSKRSATPLRLIGRDRAQDFLINHLYPRLLCGNSASSATWSEYKHYPAPSNNDNVTRAARRLFGQHPQRAQFLKKAWHHQALLQIYQDFCLADTSECDDCPFPEQLPEWIKS